MHEETPFDQGRYDEAIQASCLQSDLDVFVDGDRTQVGALARILW